MYNTDSGLSEKRSSIAYIVGTRSHCVNVTDDLNPRKVSILLIEISKSEDGSVRHGWPLTRFRLLHEEQ